MSSFLTREDLHRIMYYVNEWVPPEHPQAYPVIDCPLCRKLKGPGVLRVDNIYEQSAPFDIQNLFTMYGKVDRISMYFDADHKFIGRIEVEYARKIDAMHAMQSVNEMALQQEVPIRATMP